MSVPLAPADWLEPSSLHVEGTVLLVLNQPIEDGQHFWRAWDHCEHHVVLDGATNRIERLGAVPDFVTGDGDSITDSAQAFLAKHGVEFVRDDDQYATDFMKGIRHARRRWPHLHTIYAYGALGGRHDHSWHSEHMLVRSLTQDYTLYLISLQNVTVAVQAAATIASPLKFIGPSIGILPVDGSTRLTTRGLEWDVEDWETSLHTQISTSNHVLRDEFYVEASKPVLVTLELRRD